MVRRIDSTLIATVTDTYNLGLVIIQTSVRKVITALLLRSHWIHLSLLTLVSLTSARAALPLSASQQLQTSLGSS